MKKQMNRSIELKIQEGNMIALPVFVMKQLLLRDGDTIRLSFDNEMKQHCFHIKSENEEELFDEDFYCVPKRIFEECGITYDDIQLIMNDGSMTLTSSDQVISALGEELVACLTLQDVDFRRLADDLVDCMNWNDEENLQGS